ncbi:MAG TPA: Ig-like domain-containing protein [Prolixibacteraceae bacterium]|nr:Ig-like domain-containing protein [Prolixibacteraceae bacterium]
MAGQSTFSVTINSTRIYKVDKQPNIISYTWNVYTDANLTKPADATDATLRSLGAGRENEVEVKWLKAETLYLCIRAIDNTGCSNRLAWIFNVLENNLPLAQRDTAYTTEQLAFTALVSNGLLSNDSDPEGGALTISRINSDSTGTVLGLFGQLKWKPDGTYTYTPNAGLDSLAFGEKVYEEFTERVSDANGGNVTTTLTVVISGENDYPVLADDFNSTIETQPVNQTTGSGNLLKNDSDPDGDLLRLASVNSDTTGTVKGKYGTLTWYRNGDYSYTGNPELDSLKLGEKVTELFTLKVDDAMGYSANSTLSITINGENDAPVITEDTNVAIQSNPVNQTTGSGNLLANDKDPEGGQLTVTQINGYLAGSPAGNYGTLVWSSNGDYTYTPNAGLDSLAEGETVTEVFTETISDGNGGLSTSKLTITITGINDAPVIANDYNATVETKPVKEVDGSGNILANDRDPDGDPLVVASVNGDVTGGVAGKYGTLIWNPDGTYTYKPNPGLDSLAENEVLIEIFNMTVKDVNSGTSLEATETLTITIVGENDIPLVNNDANSTVETLPVTQDDGSGNLLANDIDLDGDILRVESIGNDFSGNIRGTYGTLAWKPDGNYTYTPNGELDSLNENESLLEIFYVTVADGHGGSATSILSITIVGTEQNLRPIANADRITIEEDAVDQIIDVLANDIDPDKNKLTISVPYRTFVGGTAIVESGNITYNPPLNFYGNDYFVYEICDDGVPSLCDRDTVFIEITPVNDAPVANADQIVVLENTIAPTLIDVQANDVDVDGNALTTTLIAGPSSGGVATVEDGDQISYIPPTNFIGVDTLIYQVCDHGEPNLCDQDTVFVHVIDHLTANDDEYDVYAGQTDTLNILSNDYYIGKVTVEVIQHPAHGTVVLNADGSVKFTAASDYIGNDRFIYRITDGGYSDTATVRLIVHPFIQVIASASCNGEQATLDWSVSIDGTEAATVDLMILDIRGNLVQSIPGSLLKGSIPWPGTTVDPSGTVTQPEARLQKLWVRANYAVAPFNEIGVSSADYQDCNINVVVAVPDRVTITKAVQLINVLENDYDPDEGNIDPTSLAIVKYKDFIGPYHGNVNVNENGTITYIPDIRYTGLDSFVYMICDDIHPISACDTAIVRLDVFWDYKLIAVDDHLWTYKNQSKNFDVLYNDYDPDGKFDEASLKITDSPRHGTYTILSGGIIRFTPENGFVGRDTFSYEICNTNVPPDCDEAMVTVDVVENRQIVAMRDDVSTIPQKEVLISVLKNDYDPEGMIDTTSLAIVDDPASGTVKINSDGTISYLPQNGFSGVDSLVYRLCDSGFPVTCDTAVVFIDVIKNRQMVAVNDEATTGAEQNITIPVLANDYDPDGIVVASTLSVVNPSKHGKTTILANGSITYWPEEGWAGDDSLIYNVCDNGDPRSCDTAMVRIHVIDRNQAIVANPDKFTVSSNQSSSLAVLDNDHDPDGTIDLASMLIIQKPSQGTATVTANGTITYVPVNGYTGNDTFIYRVCDNGPVVSCDTALVSITVVNNLPPVAVADLVTAVNGITNTWDILSNDYDTDNGLDITSVKIIRNADHGTITLNAATGAVSYVPDDCYFGADSISYTVNDLAGNSSNVADVWITISINPALDSDSDGVPDLAEDVNKNGNPCDDDTDKDGIANYLDTDDDGDNLPTLTEDWNQSGDPSDDDNDNDGIPNYLDTDDDNDSILTIAEDPDHDGNYLNDDTDGNGIINLLDPNDDGDWLMTKDETGDLDHNGVPDYLEVWQSFARNDSAYVTVNGSKSIRVLDNDSPHMNDSTLIVVLNPANGYTTVNRDFTINYTPEPDFVGIDSFQYETCDYYNVCDEATVYITVEGLSFPQLFSPNGDGKNDTYVIGGIESYPDNQFTIYNRWGNKVYEKSGYRNDWNGWANVKFVIGSKELPVGVYYYIFKYNGKEKSGALYLER